MALLSYDFKVDQFSDTTVVFTWYSGPEGGPWTPVDLTAATGARSMIRNAPGDQSPLASVTAVLSTQGVIVLGGALGTIAVTWKKAIYTQSSPGPVPAGRQVHNVFVDWPDGTSTSVVAGAFYVNAVPTH